jgi:hypothetical protein
VSLKYSWSYFTELPSSDVLDVMPLPRGNAVSTAFVFEVDAKPDLCLSLYVVVP